MIYPHQNESRGRSQLNLLFANAVMTCVEVSPRRASSLLVCEVLMVMPLLSDGSSRQVQEKVSSLIVLERHVCDKETQFVFSQYKMSS